uniref:PDZ GRASP-type domain-containing protein n=1 Tax=Piliocolobus tephrosceles TaxID=591936 RepID=A0A8C9H9M1_9PRIM
MGAGQTKEYSGGYRILKISESSPASKCNLEIFFDYIVKIDDVELLDGSRSIYNCFVDKLKQHENKELVLIVYNCRYNQIKEVKIIPHQWKGNGLLGININYEKFNALNEGVRVLEIIKDSPAYKSNFIEFNDYIIGYEHNIVRDKNELLEYMNTCCLSNSNTNGITTFMLYVYNSETEKIRKVQIEVNKEWSGKGLLGCNTGIGYLHNISICKNEIVNNKTNIVESIKECTPLYSHKNNNNLMNNSCSFVDSEGYNVTNGHVHNIVNALDNNEINKINLSNKNDFEDKSKELFNSNNKCNVIKKNDLPIYQNENKKNYEKCSTIEQKGNEGEMHKQESNLSDKNCDNSTINNNDNNNNGICENDDDESDSITRPVNDYTNYVKNMKLYTEELMEIYEDMNKNGEILNSIKMRTMQNTINYDNLLTDTKQNSDI